MPGFPGVSGDVLFILRIAQNKTIERGVDVEPFTLGRLSKFFRESQPNAGAGDVQGQSTLMFAGARWGNLGTSVVQLLLTAIGAVAGDAVEGNVAGRGMGEEFLGGPGCLWFQKPFGFRGECVEWNPGVD